MESNLTTKIVALQLNVASSYLHRFLKENFFFKLLLDNLPH